MAIKKLVFSSLTATGFTYTAIGGIRFYDPAGVLIGSGTLDTANSTRTKAVFANFTVTATDTYASDYYSIGNAYDQAKPQTGKYTDYWYWLSSNDNQTHEITFGTAVAEISKVEFVPTPDTSPQNDRGIDAAFKAAAYDEANVLIHEYTVTPDTSSRNLLNTLLTPEWEAATDPGTTTPELRAARASLEVVTAPISDVQASRLSVEVLTYIPPTVTISHLADGTVSFGGALGAKVLPGRGVDGGLSFGSTLGAQSSLGRSLSGGVSFTSEVAGVVQAGVNLGLMASRASLEVLTQPLLRAMASRLSVEFLVQTHIPQTYTIELGGEITPEARFTETRRHRQGASIEPEGDLRETVGSQRDGAVSFFSDLGVTSTSGVVKSGRTLPLTGTLTRTVSFFRSHDGVLDAGSSLRVVKPSVAHDITSSLGFLGELDWRLQPAGVLAIEGMLSYNMRRGLVIQGGLSFAGSGTGEKLFGHLGHLTFSGIVQRTSRLVSTRDVAASLGVIGAVSRRVRKAPFGSSLSFLGIFPSAMQYEQGGISFASSLAWAQRKRLGGGVSFGIWVEKPLNRTTLYGLDPASLWFNGDSGARSQQGTDAHLDLIGDVETRPFTQLALEGTITPTGELVHARGTLRLHGIDGSISPQGELDLLTKRHLDGELSPGADLVLLLRRSISGLLVPEGGVSRRLGVGAGGGIDFWSDVDALLRPPAEVVDVRHNPAYVGVVVSQDEVVVQGQITDVCWIESDVVERVLIRVDVLDETVTDADTHEAI